MMWSSEFGACNTGCARDNLVVGTVVAKYGVERKLAAVNANAVEDRVREGWCGMRCWGYVELG